MIQQEPSLMFGMELEKDENILAESEQGGPRKGLGHGWAGVGAESSSLAEIMEGLSILEMGGSITDADPWGHDDNGSILGGVSLAPTIPLNDTGGTSTGSVIGTGRKQEQGLTGPPSTRADTNTGRRGRLRDVRKNNWAFEEPSSGDYP
jgi:hypothetical protein